MDALLDQVRDEGREALKEPPRFKVLIVNDDYTPGEFVISALIKVFRIGIEAAVAITLETHHRGVGVCGEFPRDVAETKATEVIAVARAASHPLMARIEPT